MKVLADFIKEVARDVRKLCLAEPRCVHVRAPCYILGDIHGNFQDLVAFQKALWPIGPALSPASFLFLGDYVDRGAHSVEVVTYLLAQKLISPSKFKLLRGNHETRIQNAHSGYNPCFKDSCVKLFGQQVGHDVWESVNQVFDALPLAAIVDNSIFCVHGGIPAPAVLRLWSVGDTDSRQGRDRGFDMRPGPAALIAEINKIPRDLPQPDPSQPQGDSLAWDLMWNDPAPSVSAGAHVEGLGTDGFGHNQSRGTAHMFSSEALDQFLRRSGLSHLVRAHEVRKTGFQVQQHSRMVTLFSSSGYCGANNEACCILACEGKLRFIRLEHNPDDMASAPHPGESQEQEEGDDSDEEDEGDEEEAFPATYTSTSARGASHDSDDEDGEEQEAEQVEPEEEEDDDDDGGGLVDAGV